MDDIVRTFKGDPVLVLEAANKLHPNLQFTICNSLLLKSHMRLKKSRPLSGTLSLVFFYLKRSEPIRFTCDMRLKTRYSLKATTKIPPPPPPLPTLENKNVRILRSQNTQNTRTPLITGSEQSVQLLFIRQWNFDLFQTDQPKNSP